MGYHGSLSACRSSGQPSAPPVRRPPQRPIRRGGLWRSESILVGAPLAIQSITSAGSNRQLRTPNLSRRSWPHRYARLTVSSWQPTSAATSNVVRSRRGTCSPSSRGPVISPAAAPRCPSGSRSCMARSPRQARTVRLPAWASHDAAARQAPCRPFSRLNAEDLGMADSEGVALRAGRGVVAWLEVR